MKRVVITGGTHSGKTTLINYLEKEGYSVVHEAAIDVIESLGILAGVDNVVGWRRRYPLAFQELVWERVCALESKLDLDSKVVFFDRGLFDGLAYSESKDFYRVFDVRFREKASYDVAFVLDTLSDYHLRAETGRTSSYEASVEVGKKLAEIYSEEGVRTYRVSEDSVINRVEFIIKTLGGSHADSRGKAR